jgi:MAF protein
MRAPALVLASASPRRRELLSLLGLPFLVDPPQVEEDLPLRAADVPAVARRLARQKALTVAARHPGSVVLAADTVVALRGHLLGKPATPAEAEAMLRLLVGREHRVVTAVTVARGRRVLLGHATSRVRLRSFGDHELRAYVESGAPFDKAGAYAIQDQGFRPVAACSGCYCNVVGLPLALAAGLLVRAGVPLEVGVDSLLPQCRGCPLWRDAGRLLSAAQRR